MTDYSKLTVNLIALVGGKKNITEAWHCVTRLRFNVRETGKVKIDEIKKIKGVMGAQFSGDQFQIIIGNEVDNVYVEIAKELGELASGSPRQKKEKQGIVNTLMDTISGIFTPALPALVGTGLLKGFLALFVTFGWLTESTSTYQILNMIGDCAFYFLPFFLAVTSARKFKTNEFVAMCIAGVLLYPTMLNGFHAMSSGEPIEALTLFGILPIPYLPYTSSVIPIILATYFLKHVYNWIKKWMPKAISIMFTPMLSLLIVIPVTLVALGPLGTYAGGVLSIGISWLFDHLGFIAGAVVGAIYPLAVMTGMHYAFAPLMINNFAELGYDNSMAPAMLAATFAMAGATLAVFIRTKNNEMKQVSLSAGISAFIGITEPAMYGVTLKLKKPFYGAMIGGALAGAFLALFKVKSYSMAMPGLIALAGYVSPDDSKNIIITIIGVLIAVLGALITTIILGFEDEKNEKTNQTGIKSEDKEQLNIMAPVDGKIVPVETLEDKAFAEQIMGHTIAVNPLNGKIKSPVSGEISFIAETKHAIGIKSDHGMEILLHLGIDTVELKGEGFGEPKVKIGNHVKAGELLLEMDIDTIVKKKYNPIVLTIVTNSEDYLNILATSETDNVKAGSAISAAVR